MGTQEAIQILISHDMLEEAEKLRRIAVKCECVDCNDMGNQNYTEQCQGYPWARFKRGNIEPLNGDDSSNHSSHDSGKGVYYELYTGHASGKPPSARGLGE